MTKPKKLKIVSYAYKYDPEKPIKCKCGNVTNIYHVFEFSDGTKDVVCPKCYMLSDKYPKSKKYLVPTGVD